MKDTQIAQLLLQALETGIGGTQAYVTAVKCVINADLEDEFNKPRPDPVQRQDYRGAAGELSLNPRRAQAGARNHPPRSEFPRTHPGAHTTAAKWASRTVDRVSQRLFSSGRRRKSWKGPVRDALAYRLADR